MSDSFIQRSSLSGKAVAAVATKIAEAVDGHQNDSIIAACLGIVIMLQKPDIDSDDLAECVFDVSQYISMVLSDGFDPDAPMN